MNTKQLTYTIKEKRTLNRYRNVVMISPPPAVLYSDPTYRPKLLRLESGEVLRTTSRSEKKESLALHLQSRIYVFNAKG